MGNISLVDNGFLLTESQNSPKHVACLQVWELPKGKGSAWLRGLLADLKEHPAGFPFNQKLQYKIPLQPELVTDRAIDMDYHVRHTVLPHPGDDEQLWKMVARLHANLLDRERPLWEFHLIEGLANRRFAFYTKIHHALADGITLNRWFTDAGSKDSSEHDTLPIWHGEKIRPKASKKEPGYARLLGESIRVFGGSIRTALDMTTLTIRLVNGRLFAKNRDITLPLAAPRTPLNVTTGSARALTAVSFQLEDVKAVAVAQGVTVNDVLLTMVDLAIHRYFTEKGSPLEDALVVYMPVNLRTENDRERGNLVSLLQVRLSSKLSDPLTALHEIRRSSRTAREVFSGFGKPAIQLYSLAVALISLFEESLKLSKFLPPVQNLVVSNVPGPRNMLYFRGAKGVHAYPISTLPPLTALNVTANSYAGQMNVGLVAGRTVIPDIDRLAEHIGIAFTDLVALT
ncbi:MAG: wax ester/triacylglycerol synthase family O-acyltransferase [Xanthomonadales bacterium]|nr:wax ester/triacylglycerol synthase family O-acyltransferase [Gammaproteobacteria bacterium]MBT8050194.1 wax ester/triacylglycerol synthase family O-acyltransferase [Gammaproteobacteria bacterium]MBT8055625.1 wax ester/triacylglycerol synthase family O-acyltransferase [Gammaproteobacteria bacterium]NNL05441.1 wax ester/triacylglycerol synthase family O-acyltransferase [Xanthomonadales bacterium]